MVKKLRFFFVWASPFCRKAHKLHYSTSHHLVRLPCTCTKSHSLKKQIIK